MQLYKELGELIGVPGLCMFVGSMIGLFVTAAIFVLGDSDRVDVVEADWWVEELGAGE